MTLNEYRQHLIGTMRKCDIHDTAIGVAMEYVPVPELSKQAAQLCWLLGHVAAEHICMLAVRDYLNVLNREGEYVFDKEPAPLPSIHPEPWLAVGGLDGEDE